MTITVAIKLNGGAAGAPLAVAAGAAITATLDSVAGVNSVAWSIAAADDLSVPGDYTLVTSGIKGETVDFNALATLGTAAILQAVVNADPTLYARAKFFVPAANGRETGADGEGYEGDATHGTARIMNDAIRASGSGSYCPATRVLTAGTGMTGGGDMTADRTFDVVANADGSITVNANDIQVGILATDAQHGNRGGGGIHANAVAGSPGTSGFMTGAQALLVDNATATPTASTIAKWGASVDLGATYFWENGFAGTLANTGLIRIGNGATVVLAGHAAAGTANRRLLAWDTAEFAVGLDATAVDVNGASTAALGAGGTKAVWVTATGAQLFSGGSEDFAGGTGILGITEASVEPTTVPGSGNIVAWAKTGQLKAKGPKGLVYSASADASGAQTLSIADVIWWSVQTTNATSTPVATYATAVPEGGQFAIEVWVMGIQTGSDLRTAYKMLCTGGRAPAGTTVVDATSATVIIDNIGVAGAPLVAIVSNATQIQARGKAATTIEWTVEGTIRIWKP